MFGVADRRAVPLLERVRGRLYPELAWGTARVFLSPVIALPSPERRAPFRAREVAGEELVALAPSFGRPREQFARRVAEGHRCVCTFAEGLAVHMRWFARGPTEIPELGVFACPGGREVYTYDSHTNPGWRRMGAMSAERRAMYRILAAEKIERCFSYILAGNAASLATLLPQARLVLSVPFLRVRGVRLMGAPLSHPLYREPRGRLRARKEVAPGGLPPGSRGAVGGLGRLEGTGQAGGRPRSRSRGEGTQPATRKTGRPDLSLVCSR